jgi:RNA polymerase sigma-70 factor (ECF subfamily)
VKSVKLMMIAVVNKTSEEQAAPKPASRPLREAAPDLAKLYEEHSRAIYYLCLRLLADSQKAEDATHDVFLKAWRHMDQFEGRSTWRTWLYRVAINHCRNLQLKWSERHILPTENDHVLQDTVADHASPLRLMEIKELGQRIQCTLARLPPEYRILLLLVADQELSYAEVADLTQQTSDAVRGKLHRARRMFASEFHKTE